MRKKKLYYNPMEIPKRIRYISKENDIDIIAEEPWTENIGMRLPVYFDEMFKALKKGLFDEIKADISSHECCYYWDKDGNQVPVVGKTNLSEFVDGGGYLRDKRLVRLSAKNEK